MSACGLRSRTGHGDDEAWWNQPDGVMEGGEEDGSGSVAGWEAHRPEAATARRGAAKRQQSVRVQPVTKRQRQRQQAPEPAFEELQRRPSAPREPSEAPGSRTSPTPYTLFGSLRPSTEFRLHQGHPMAPQLQRDRPALRDWAVGVGPHHR